MNSKLNSKKNFKEGRMRKLLKVTTTALMLGGVLASGAVAGTLNLVDDTDLKTSKQPLYLPVEAIKGNDDVVSLDDTAQSQIAGVTPGAGSVIITSAGTTTAAIIYTPSTDLPSGTRLVFELQNGEWGDNEYYLINKDDESIVATTDAVNGNQLVFIVGNSQVPAGTQLVLSAAQPNGDGVLDPAEVKSPKIKVYESFATSGVTVGVTQAYDSVGTIYGGLADPITIIKPYQQFVATVTKATATIDVNEPSYRKNFVDETAVGGDTTLTTTTAKINIINKCDVADLDGDGTDDTSYCIDLDTNANVANISMVIKAESSMVGVASIELIGDDGTKEPATIDVTNGTATINVDASTGGGVFINGVKDDVKLTLTGEDILYPQDFKVDLNLDFASDTTYNDDSLIAGDVIYEWNINGAQFKIPYLYNSSSTFVRIANEASMAGEISVDLFDESGNIIRGVSLGTVPGQGARVIFANEIVEAAKAAGWTPDSTGRFTAIFTVAAPANNVSAIAVQKIPGGVDRVIPVLTSDTTSWKQ